MKVNAGKSVQVLIKSRYRPPREAITKTYEAGIVLVGPEVKAIKIGRASLGGAHIILRNQNAYLEGATIGPYPPASHNNPNPHRPRKLLLQHHELRQLVGYANAKGLTVIPLSVYTKANHIKVSLVVAKRTKTIDRRETIKKRDFERRKQQALRT